MAGGTVIASLALCLVFVMANDQDLTAEDLAKRKDKCDRYRNLITKAPNFKKYLESWLPPASKPCPNDTIECEIRHTDFCIPEAPDNSPFHDEEIVANYGNDWEGKPILYANTNLTNKDQPSFKHLKLHARSIWATRPVSVQGMVIFTTDYTIFKVAQMMKSYSDLNSLKNYSESDIETGIEIITAKEELMELQPGKTKTMDFSSVKVPNYVCKKVYVLFAITTGFNDEEPTQVYIKGPPIPFLVIPNPDEAQPACIHPKAAIALNFRETDEIISIDVDEDHKINKEQLVALLQKIGAQVLYAPISNREEKGKISMEIYMEDALIASYDAAINTVNIAIGVWPLVDATAGQGVFTSTHLGNAENGIVTERGCFTDAEGTLEIFVFYGEHNARVYIDVEFTSIPNVTSTYWTDILNIGCDQAIVQICKPPRTTANPTSETIELSTRRRDRGGRAFKEVSILKGGSRQSGLANCAQRAEGKANRRMIRALRSAPCDFGFNDRDAPTLAACKQALNDSRSRRRKTHIPAVCYNFCNTQLDLLGPIITDTEGPVKTLTRMTKGEKADRCMQAIKDTVTLRQAFPGAQSDETAGRKSIICHAWKQWKKANMKGLPNGMQQGQPFCSGCGHQRKPGTMELRGNGNMGPMKDSVMNMNDQMQYQRDCGFDMMRNFFNMITKGREDWFDMMGNGRGGGLDMMESGRVGGLDMMENDKGRWPDMMESDQGGGLDMMERGIGHWSDMKESGRVGGLDMMQGDRDRSVGPQGRGNTEDDKGRREVPEGGRDVPRQEQNRGDGDDADRRRGGEWSDAGNHWSRMSNMNGGGNFMKDKSGYGRDRKKHCVTEPHQEELCCHFDGDTDGNEIKICCMDRIRETVVCGIAAQFSCDTCEK